tara:strand:- start:225 stop:770 length:546 start_codon:yes stop_codon:yes gene_type:complete
MLKRIKQALKGRRDELAQYEMEANLHAAELVELDAMGLPADWSDDVKKWQAASRDQIAVEVPAALLETVIGLRDRDWARAQLRACNIEIETTTRRMNALAGQLPAGEDETPTNPLTEGLASLAETVADPANPFVSFAVDVPSLREVDGVGMGRVVLTDTAGKRYPKFITVSESGVKMVDAE